MTEKGGRRKGGWRREKGEGRFSVFQSPYFGFQSLLNKDLKTRLNKTRKDNF
jgi:hypothetical protein